LDLEDYAGFLASVQSTMTFPFCDRETSSSLLWNFMRADQGSPDVLELFHEDAEVCFPKFGFGFGRNSFLEIVKGFEGTLESIQHDYDRLTFIPSADYLVVEGTSQGRMSGKSWAGGKTPGGRFCNVFKFRDGRISSLHIYLDPDYTGEDEARFRWGKHRQW
jgi:ketosteroid isomerase-like protein